jgi:hypothetical protein
MKPQRSPSSDRTGRRLEPSPASLARVDYPNTDGAVRRAAGLARNLKTVLRRTGLGGFAALVADRATPNVRLSGVPSSNARTAASRIPSRTALSAIVSRAALPVRRGRPPAARHPAAR